LSEQAAQQFITANESSVNVASRGDTTQREGRGTVILSIDVSVDPGQDLPAVLAIINVTQI